MSVPKRLKKLRRIFKKRNKVYGKDYLKHGKLMVAMFPKGIKIKTVDDFNRYALLKDIVTKLNRYAATFTTGGHVDSLDDLSVYAQMLQELDNERKG